MFNHNKITKEKNAVLKKNGNYSFFFQPKITINQPNDVYEQEADAVAEKVMRMSNEPQNGNMFFRPANAPVQRKCADCEEEEKKKLHRKEITDDITEASAQTENYIHSLSGGRALSEKERDFFEPRMGYDFSDVKIHTGVEAAKSAQSINALAYTTGNSIVFNQNQFQPETDNGKKLLAHELTHVVQQQNLVQASVQRRLASRLTLCTGGTAGAPADPVAELTRLDARAMDMATQISQSLAADAAAVLHGIPAAPSVTFQSYQTNFGLPNAVGRRFQNRLTGTLVDTQEIAMHQELSILSRRFGMVATLYSQFMNYVCSDLGQTRVFGGCSNGPCDQGDAWSCRGSGVIFICPSFWNANNFEQQASILVHEAFHILLGPTDPRGVGQIGDETLNGPGRNFNIAGCYEQMLPDFFGFDSVATCPAPGV